jgi:hypothetical protein
MLFCSAVAARRTELKWKEEKAVKSATRITSASLVPQFCAKELHYTQQIGAYCISPFISKSMIRSGFVIMNLIRSFRLSGALNYYWLWPESYACRPSPLLLDLAQ